MNAYVVIKRIVAVITFSYSETLVINPTNPAHFPANDQVFTLLLAGIPSKNEKT